MPSPINKKTLKHLSLLARIELTPKEEEKLLKDLQKILDHFTELQEVDTEDIEGITGGTALRNVFREDEEQEGTNRGMGVEDFPESHGGFLKVPAVFEEDDSA